MAPEGSFAWVTVLLLGSAHGLNPAMGWLFAVSLGLQEQDGRAVWRALGPLALGHALAILATLLGAALLGLVLPLSWLKWIAASALLAFGAFHLVRHAHPRVGGMLVGRRELTLWSFLMASAHGAGLMVLPFALRLLGPSAHGAHSHAAGMLASGHASHLAPALAGHGGHLALAGFPGADLGAPGLVGGLVVVLHTAGYLAVAGILAFVVYRKLGLRLLRTAWINLDLFWAGALVITALLTPLL